MKVNYWKFGVIASAFAGIFLLGRSCGIHSVEKTAGQTITVEKDSLIFVDKPVPYKVDTPIYVHDKLSYPVFVDKPISVPQFVDTNLILKQFFSIAYYDTTYFKGTDSAQVKETVTQNRIVAREVRLFTVDSTITNTTILKIPKKLVGYIGFSAAGIPNFYFAGADFSIKTPNDKIYSVGVLMGSDGKIYYSAGLKIPIHLIK